MPIATDSKSSDINMDSDINTTNEQTDHISFISNLLTRPEFILVILTILFIADIVISVYEFELPDFSLDKIFSRYYEYLLFYFYLNI